MGMSLGSSNVSAYAGSLSASKVVAGWFVSLESSWYNAGFVLWRVRSASKACGEVRLACERLKVPARQSSNALKIF